MSLALLDGVRFDSIEMHSDMNNAIKESESGKIEFRAATGLSFSPAKSTVGIIYGNANIELTATEFVGDDVGSECEDDAGSVLFRLKLIVSLRYELVDEFGARLNDDVSDYLSDEANIHNLTAQAQPVLNDKINYLISNSGLNPSISYNAILFKGKRAE